MAAFGTCLHRACERARSATTWCGHQIRILLQVKEKKDFLARLETLDNGKPITEAAWDIVGISLLTMCPIIRLTSAAHIWGLSVSLCRLCATNALNDEKHLVFECPELECFSQRWSHLFQGPRTMTAFMWQDDNIGIARFINVCLRKTREGQTSDQPGVAGRDVI